MLRQIKMLHLAGGCTSANRLRQRRHLSHRHRPRCLPLRYRCHLCRSGCPNYPTRNGRRRTNGRWSGRRRRHNCRRPPRRCRQTIVDFRGGSAIASSARSKSATCHRPQFRRPSLRSSSFALPLNAGWRLIVHRKKALSGQRCRRMWQPRSLIIQAKCETFAATDRLIRCPWSMRKVKP